MKRILLGLVAMSAISFAAAPDVSVDPADGTNVFSQIQTGHIPVKGKVTSNVPIVKYVVFASTGDGSTLTGAESELQLSDFVISSNLSLAGFVDTNPTVYVRKVIASNTLEVPTAEIGFRIKMDPAWTAPLTQTKYSDFTTNGTVDFNFGMLMTKQKLEDMLPSLGDDKVLVSNWGAFYIPSKSSYITKQINAVISDATLKFVDGSEMGGGSFDTALASKVEASFAGGVDLESNLLIEVKLK